VWEEGGFVPRMPEGLEALDLLLLSVGKVRRVQQDGISFRGLRYLSPTLAAYVKEEVELRYDPRDMAEIRVFHRGTFVCRAICEELSGEVVSLKEIVSARRARKKDVQGQISEREAVVQRYLEVHRPPKKVGGASEGEGVKNGSTLKRYWNE